jgi:hypothetical protein
MPGHISSLSPMRYVTEFPISALRRLGLIVVAAFATGTILPGIICYSAGVFSQSQLEETLHRQSSKFPDVIRNGEKVAQLREVLRRVDEVISNTQTINLGGVSDWLKVREYFASQTLAAEREISVVPFFLSHNMLVFTAAFASLGTLIYILGPLIRPLDRRYGLLQTFLVMAPIYVVYHSEVWLRNFVLHSEGRKVYIFANFDVSPIGFFMQECQLALLFSLLAFVWYQWLNYFAVCKDSQKRESPLAHGAAQHLGELFLHWQLTSVVLAFGFVYFTGVYWDLVVGKNDQRYVFPAIAIHCIWGLSWIILSLPVVTSWYAWHSGKQALLVRLYEAPDEHSELKLKILQEVTPVGFWNAVASGIAAVASFLLPVLKHLFGWG